MPTTPSQVNRDLNLNSGNSVELAFTEDILRGALTVDITPGGSLEVNRGFADLTINREWDGESIDRKINKRGEWKGKKRDFRSPSEVSEDKQYAARSNEQLRLLAMIRNGDKSVLKPGVIKENHGRSPFDPFEKEMWAAVAAKKFSVEDARTLEQRLKEAKK